MREDPPFNMKWTKEPVRTLRIFVSYDEKGSEKTTSHLKLKNLIPVFTFGDPDISVYLAGA